MKFTASWTVLMCSASSSGISTSNSSSIAITSSTMSSESAPRSSMKADSAFVADADLADFALLAILVAGTLHRAVAVAAAVRVEALGLTIGARLHAVAFAVAERLELAGASLGGDAAVGRRRAVDALEPVR